MITHRLRLPFLILGFGATALAFAGEPGQTVSNIDLKSEPFADAKTVSNLAPKTVLEVLKRQGGWLQVKTSDGANGWVKMTGVKLDGAGAPKSGDSGLSNAINVATTGRSGNTGVTVATGVRGLSPDDLKNAKPDPDAIKKLDSYTVAKPEAENFARSGGVSKHSVDYLVDGNSSSSSSSSGSSSSPGLGTGLKNLFGGGSK